MIIEMIIGDLILNEIGVIHETCIVSDFWLNLRALKFLARYRWSFNGLPTTFLCVRRWVSVIASIEK